MDTNNSLQPEQIKKKLTSRWLGHTIHYYQQLDSTNLTAMELAKRDAPEGTVVLAEQQLLGRGRGDRSWHSPPGVGVYCSVILRPKLLPSMGQLITLMTAVAVAKTVSLKTDLSPQIKWPNDILVNENKVGGILIEGKARPTGIDYIVVGIGINVNHTSADLPEDLLLRASSLRMELGETVERDELIAQLFAELESLCERLQQEDSAYILEQWRSFSATLGQRVRVIQKDGIIEGVAVDVNEEGALLLRVEEDSLVEVHAGDVRHLKLG